MDPFPGIRPRPSISRQLDMAARYAFPGTTTILLILVSGIPLGIPGHAEAQAAVALACVFFWSLFRPASMPPLLVFALGLLVDLLDFAPAGINVLGLLLVLGVALRWRRVLSRQGFLLVWLACAAVSAAVAALDWATTALLMMRLPSPAPAVLQAGLGAGLYPALATILTRAHHTLAEPARA